MDDRFDRLFSDLEAAARAQEAHERAGEYSDRLAEAYSELELVSRLAGVLGAEVRIHMRDRVYRGMLAELGEDWIRLEQVGESGSQVLLRTSAIDYLVIPPGGGAGAGLRMSIRSALREMAQSSREVRIETLGGLLVDGAIMGVGCDFVHLRQPAGDDPVIPIASIAAVTSHGEG